MKASNDIQISYIRKPIQEPYAGGEVQLQLEQARAGRAFYTAPIDTGFGPGEHVLSFWLVDELGVDDVPLQTGRLIVGDPGVFEQSSYLSGLPKATISAMLDPATGAFQMGIRLEQAYSGCLRLGWRARREELLSEKEQDARKARTFYIANPPKSIAPGRMYTFRCSIAEGLEGTVQWSVLGEDCGTIDKHGRYTAPGRQGMFEVCAALEGADLTTSVYVMVKE